MGSYSEWPDAVAYMRGGSGAPELTGTVKFYQRRESVLVEARICGLPRGGETGFFAMHIHEGGSCAGVDFEDTGGHLDLRGASHPEHTGDLPPLMMCGGGAYLVVKTDRFRVQDVIGRTVVIHSGADDFRSQPAGNAGTKIACGVIRRSQNRADCR